MKMCKLLLGIAVLGGALMGCLEDDEAVDAECVKYCDATACDPATADKDRKDCLDMCAINKLELEALGCWKDQVKYMKCMYKKTCAEQAAAAAKFEECTQEKPFYNCYDADDCAALYYGAGNCQGIIYD